MTDPRIVLCEACGSEGRIYRAALRRGPPWDDGAPCEDDCGPCPCCDGTGLAVIETEPIEMEDLDVES